jgi:hypothetical protein
LGRLHDDVGTRRTEVRREEIPRLRGPRVEHRPDSRAHRDGAAGRIGLQRRDAGADRRGDLGREQTDDAETDDQDILSGLVVGLP